MIFVIGKDVEGRVVCGNIAKMKHLLVGGSPGSGKSQFLHTMIAGLINKYSPKELRLILMDAKKSEFALYNGVPHLLTGKIVSDMRPAINALNWAIKETERRYGLYVEKCREGKAVHNIEEYNLSREEGEQRLPRILIIIDELSDFMFAAKNDMEERILCLKRKAHAAGIHLVLATQCASIDVINGVVKVNISARVAFRMNQEIDSRVFLDEPGAEKLFGNGDMLYKTDATCACSRIQGAYLSSEELMGIVESVKGKYTAHFDESAKKEIEQIEIESKDESAEVPPFYIKALAIVIKAGIASASLLQRECAIGYRRACKIIEWMETMGYVSAFDRKAKARTVLLSKEEFEAKYGSLDE